MVVSAIISADGKDAAGTGEAAGQWRRRRYSRHGFLLQRLHQDALQAAHINQVYGESLLTGGIKP